MLPQAKTALWISSALFSLFPKDQNKLVHLVGDERKWVAKRVEVLAHVVPDPVATIRQIWQLQQLLDDIGVQHVVVRARRLHILAEQHQVAARPDAGQP